MVGGGNQLWLLRSTGFQCLWHLPTMPTDLS